MNLLRWLAGTLDYQLDLVVWRIELKVYVTAFGVGLFVLAILCGCWLGYTFGR